MAQSAVRAFSRLSAVSVHSEDEPLAKSELMYRYTRTERERAEKASLRTLRSVEAVSEKVDIRPFGVYYMFHVEHKRLNGKYFH